ncbi:MAG: RNA polymerase sigma factor [Limisphaerales bacterium]
MMTADDVALVREYSRHGSEEAFATLVSRNVNLVYSVAFRQLGDADLAEEATQAAFIILARKAGSLGPKTIVSAWLCRTAQYVATRAIRTQHRRQSREQEVYVQSLLNQEDPDSSPWPDIAPLLDLAMAGLGEKDHSAIVLRYFQGKDLKQVGVALGVSENAAKTRVSRAVEKLRRFFVKRGIAVSAAVIAAAISANAVQAAPAALAKSATAMAMAKGATASGSTLTLIKGALKIMAWTKAKTAVVVGVLAVLTVGTTRFVYRHDAAAIYDPFIFSRTRELSSDVEDQYARWSGTTPEEVAKTFFAACSQEDWTKVAEFWNEPGSSSHLDDRDKKTFGGLQVIRADKPFWAWAWVHRHQKIGGAFVIYKIRLKSGRVTKVQAQFRCDNPEKRWYLDGLAMAY